MNKKVLIITVLFLIATPLWLFVIVPKLPLYRPNFSFMADVSSIDNFFDEKKQEFGGEIPSKTIFSYDVASSKNGVLLVNNIFDVRTLQGDKIFSVSRSLGINPLTGANIKGFGDHDRDGYLFAPKHLQKGQPFTYWHINYDGPANMQFVSEERLFGLKVYKYETNYEGVNIDQTKNLTNLPGVGVTRGIILDPHLMLWVEPVSGRMVKYQDETTAYYYDLVTAKKLFPWNKFHNNITDDSVKNLAYDAYAARATLFLQEMIVPILIFLLGLFFIFKSTLTESNYSSMDRFRFGFVKIVSFLTILVGITVIYGWVVDNPFLKGAVPGFPTMKFTTAIALILSGISLYLLTALYGDNEEIAELFLPISTLSLSLLMTTIFISSILGIKTGIENLFFQESQSSVRTIIAGRPSYGTLIAFLLIIISGIVGILTKTRLSLLITICGGLICGIGLTAFFGYVLNIPLLFFYHKAVDTGMAINTAILFFFYGLGLVTLGRLDKET